MDAEPAAEAHGGAPGPDGGRDAGDGGLSVFPRAPLPPSSPLSEPPPSPSTSGGGGRRPPPPRGRGGDMPVVFHARIKSSGYGAASNLPWKYQQDLRRQRQRQRQRQQARGAPPPAPAPDAGDGAAAAAAPRFVARADPEPHGAAVSSVRFSPAGTRLASASADTTVRVWRVPPAAAGRARAPSSLVGHGGAVSRVSWSRSGELLLTSSADGTARMWDVRAPPDPRAGGGAPRARRADAELICIDRLRRSGPPRAFKGARAAPSPRGAEGNPAFTEAVRHAQFLHMDALVLASHRNRLLVYRYRLPPSAAAAAAAAADDLYLQRHRFGSYRLACELENAGCVGVTDLAAHNAFISHLAIAALTNRGVHLWDLAAGRLAAAVADAHTRPVHSLAICAATAGSPLDAGAAHAACELFATSGADGCIKLWDVRAVHRRVRCFAGAHANSGHRVGMQFSPCMRYLATCSEDRAVAVYDVRYGGGACAPLPMREVPAAVDLCHRPGAAGLLLAAGGMDGQLRVFDEAGGA